MSNLDRKSNFGSMTLPVAALQKMTAKSFSMSRRKKAVIPMTAARNTRTSDLVLACLCPTTQATKYAAPMMLEAKGMLGLPMLRNMANGLPSTAKPLVRPTKVTQCATVVAAMPVAVRGRNQYAVSVTTPLL